MYHASIDHRLCGRLQITNNVIRHIKQILPKLKNGERFLSTISFLQCFFRHLIWCICSSIWSFLIAFLRLLTTKINFKIYTCIQVQCTRLTDGSTYLLTAAWLDGWLADWRHITSLKRHDEAHLANNKIREKRNMWRSKITFIIRVR